MYSQDQRYVNMKRVTELKVSQNTYRVSAVLKVETDIITRIAASPIGQATILVIMYFETFKTDVVTSRWPIISSIKDRFIDTDNITQWDQKKNVQITDI